MIIYDIEFTFCCCSASEGEICCAFESDGTCDWAATDCDSGLANYTDNYITPFASLIQQYCGTVSWIFFVLLCFCAHSYFPHSIPIKVPVVLIIEPDSLPNLATNTANPKCGNSGTRASYQEGVTAAVLAFNQACPDKYEA